MPLSPLPSNVSWIPAYTPVLRSSGTGIAGFHISALKHCGTIAGTGTAVAAAGRYASCTVAKIQYLPCLCRIFPFSQRVGLFSAISGQQHGYNVPAWTMYPLWAGRLPPAARSRPPRCELPGCPGTRPCCRAEARSLALSDWGGGIPAFLRRGIAYRGQHPLNLFGHVRSHVGTVPGQYRHQDIPDKRFQFGTGRYCGRDRYGCRMSGTS
jgi:hypothetical protein